MMDGDSGMSGKRVLIAEDDYFIAKSLARDLKLVGAEIVGPVATVADALNLVGVGAVDGAVLDINLRGEMAFAVADALVERGIPFVFASGYGNEIIPKRHSSVTICEKPTDPSVLARMLFPGTES